MENNDNRMHSQSLVSEYFRIMIGKRYRHFKGNVYKVIAIAVHSETAELMVVYRGEHDDNVWVRPISMFTSLVDREKYPDVKQEFRFQIIEE